MDVIIVDDELKAIEILEFHLKEYFPVYNIVGRYNNISDALEGLVKLRPMVLFLDINMPSGSGIELLSDISHLNVLTVFLTAHSEYAIEAIHQNAFDYLLKPVNLSELNRVHGKIQTHNFPQQSRTSEKIKIQISNNVYLFDSSEIVYAKSEGNYTTIYSTSKKPLVVSKNLKKIQEKYFSDLPFFRSHQSFIVNLNHITSYSNYDITLTENQKASLSNKKYEILSQLIP